MTAKLVASSRSPRQASSSRCRCPQEIRGPCGQKFALRPGRHRATRRSVEFRELSFESGQC